MVFLEEELQLVGAEVGEEFVFDGKGGGVGLSGEADHFGISGAVCLDVDFLK